MQTLVLAVELDLIFMKEGITVAIVDKYSVQGKSLEFYANIYICLHIIFPIDLCFNFSINSFYNFMQMQPI